MNDTKTLKDMPNIRGMEQGGVVFARNWARSEAIEWVKELQAMPPQIILTENDKPHKLNDLVSNITRNSIINWIVHFFNITKEELE